MKRLLILFFFALCLTTSAWGQVLWGSVMLSKALDQCTTVDYSPAHRRLVVRIDKPSSDALWGNTAAIIAVMNQDDDYREITRTYCPVDPKDGGYAVLNLPPIPDGKYTVSVTLGFWGPAIYRTIEQRSNAPATPVTYAKPAKLPYLAYYYPSSRKLDLGVLNLLPGTAPLRVRYQVTGPQNAKITSGAFQVSETGGQKSINLPKLADGDYTVHFATAGYPAETKTFMARTFPWVGNTLGITDKVYAPFTPLAINGNDISMVQRTYRMNSFGLWDSVLSEGRELLASPMTLKLQTASSAGQWMPGESRWIKKAGNESVYTSEVTSSAVTVRTTSTIAFDGCMKVAVDLLPGKKPESISHLTLEIPLKDKEAGLFHYCSFESMRRNYAGQTPRGGKITWTNQRFDSSPRTWDGGTLPPVWKTEPGSDDGTIWTCRDIRPWMHVIRTDFVPYIWLGGAERGIAFFGENDKGYLLDPKGVMQRIEREGDVLYLRVDLINTPSIVTKPRHIVFGLQASPTRPMPKDWRANFSIPPHGGPVVVWGGYICADKYPDGYNYTIIDAIMKARATGVIDTAMMEKADKARKDPAKLMFGNEKWIGNTMNWFVNQAKGRYEDSLDWTKHTHDGILPDASGHFIATTPLITYFEEHAEDITTDEWLVYQDEWRSYYPWPEKQMPAPAGTQASNTMNHGFLNFPESYRDFALYYANELMKRGVGVYFDNTQPDDAWNPAQSDAFYDDDGILHPACTIWEQRAYYQRIWTLEQQWKEHGTPAPLCFTMHVTNTNVLPFNTWNDASLDLEWSWHEEGDKYSWGDKYAPLPFPPDLLLTETAARQTGSYSHALMGVNGWLNKAENNPRAEWGMRVVHEIIHGDDINDPSKGKLDTALWKFGYATDRCQVINYWADDAPIAVSDPEVKWLLLVRKSDKALLLVLQSWKKDDTTVNITIDPARLGFTPENIASDAESNETVPVDNNSFTTTLIAPYGVREIVIGEK